MIVSDRMGDQGKILPWTTQGKTTFKKIKKKNSSVTDKKLYITANITLLEGLP
jgi:hypothetical protein